MTMECSLFSKSGAELKVRAQISRIEDPQGRSLYQIMEQDVSRERRAEAQCAQLEQKMALMDELTDQPMVRMPVSYTHLDVYKRQPYGPAFPEL